MRRISPAIALYCVLSVLYPIPRLWAGDATAPATASGATEICFPIGEGERMLRDLESLPPCRDAVAAAEDVIRAAEARSQALESRVSDQDRELSEARKLVDDTRKAGEEAAKVAAGPWYTKVLAAAKWIGLGIVLGFVGAVGK